MNLIWNKNLSQFKTRFKSLANLMQSRIDTFNAAAGTPREQSILYPFWNISVSRTNLPVAEENGLRLHSVYNPEREAQTLLASRKDEIAGCKAIVFCGMGLGYAPLQAAAACPDKTIIIIEPDLNHFLGAMCLVDFTPLFSHSSIIFAAGCQTDQAITLLNQYGILYSTIFATESQTIHAKPYFDQLGILIKRNRNKEEINNATLEKFRKLWFRNSKKNIRLSATATGVNAFANRGKNIPFLILGAGPSLEKVLPLLNRIKNKTVTVCVDTALKACLRHNYQPDFIVLTDPQYWAWRHIAGLKSPESILIAENAVYPAAFGFDCKNIVCCSSQIPVGRFFEEYCGTLGSLGAGGSVASCAWNFAQLAGSTKIFVCGLDLSFPKKQTHIKGSTFEQAVHTNSLKTKPAELGGMPLLYSGNACWEKNYSGSPVLTDQRMKMFAWWFESRLAACPENKTYTVSPEGLNIPGITPVELEELLKLPEIKAEKKDFLHIAEKLACPSEKESAFNRAKSDFNAQITRALNISTEALKNLKSSSPDPEFFQKQLAALKIISVLELIPSTKLNGVSPDRRYEESFKAISEFCSSYIL